MKKKLFIATLVAITTLSFASCGQTKTSDSSSTMLVTEQVEVEASVNENGDAVLDTDDSNIEIEEIESGDKIATIKSEDGSEVKVAVKEDSNGNTIIDTSKVVDSDGTVKKATDDSKTEVKVDSDGTVSVVVTTDDSDDTVITTSDPHVSTTTTTSKPNKTKSPTTTSTHKPTTTEAPKPTTTPKVTEALKPTTTEAPKVTNAPTTTSTPKPTTTPKVTKAPKPTTTAHVHSWTPVYKTIKHPTEYATKTIWMYSPLTYSGNKINAELPYGPNRIIFDDDYNFTRKNYYDLLCYKYGSIYKIPDEYIIKRITKDNYSEYDLSYEKFCELPMTDYENGNVVTFNPDLDIFVCIDGGAANECDYGWYGGSDCWEAEYQAVAQETIKVKDAWTETIVDHYECSCGAHK